jgi:hypothetical protein
MAKSFLGKIRKYKYIILIASIVVFILLVLLGAILGPDKTWEPPANMQRTESR